MRGELVTNALSDSIADCAQGETPRGRARLQALFDRAVQDERLFAIGLCSLDGTLLRQHRELSALAGLPAGAAATPQLPEPRLRRRRAAPVHVGVHTVDGEAGPIAELVLLHDLSFIERRSQDTRRYLIVFIAVLGPGDRADHRGRRAAELARLGLGRARRCCAARA